jgi:cation diffusion facilitator family transporter
MKLIFIHQFCFKSIIIIKGNNGSIILMNEKTKAAGISILSNTFLIISKLLVGLFTNSVSIISEAVHSFMDLLAAVIAFFSVKKSAEPADDDHQYGHGKYEDVSGFAEGALILIAAFYIIYESIEKIYGGKIDYIDSIAGIAVMALSVIVNIFVSKNLAKVAKETDSMALLADAEHLKTDVLTSAGVLLGLILIKLTGIKILDPVVAIFVAFLIIKAGFELCSISLKNLLDSSLPEEDIEKIQSILTDYSVDKIISYEHLKTRKSGAEKLIEFTLIMPKDQHLADSHCLCDAIEADLKKNISRAFITIHTEPCDSECAVCNLKNCDSYI